MANKKKTTGQTPKHKPKQKPKQKPKPSPQQLAAMRQRLIDDPNTKKIAETVKMPLEKYIESVMKYLANPNLEPQLKIVPDAELRKQGVEPPDLKKISAFVKERADAQEISTKSKFADPNSQREKVAGKIPVTPAATARPEQVRKDLQADLERSRTSGKFNKF